MSRRGEIRDEPLDEQAEARRRLALAQIRQYPEAVLRLSAQAVETFDGDLHALVERMAALMRDANGVGLAANQVGVLRRVFVFQQEDAEDVTVAVNPRVVQSSDDVESDEEGCLSLQGVRVPVERHVAVTLAAQELTGAERELELSGLTARVAQHELDHLDGVLILDRTSPEGRREAMAVLRPQPVLGPI